MLVGTATEPVALGEVRPAGRKAMRRHRLGARCSGIEPIASGWDEVRRPSRGPHSTHRREPARPAGRGGPGRRGPPVDPARRAAYEALAAVHRDDAYANIVLPRLLRETTGSSVATRPSPPSSPTARCAARASSTRSSRTQPAGRCDRIDPPARDALRLGAYQLLHTRVPAHAAVATTVDLVRLGRPGAVGFANAVMRAPRPSSDLDDWLAPGGAQPESPIRSGTCSSCTPIHSG